MTFSDTSHVGDEDDFDPFAAGAIERTVASTEAQREVWLADRMGAQASLAYNESLTLRLRGVVDSAALIAAFDALVARHPALRASFSPDGSQLLIGEATPLPLGEHDLRHLDAAAQARELAAECTDAVREHFDLARGPLFRAALYRLSTVEALVVMTAHHAVCDGWSWGVIADDLGRLYAQQTGDGPALAPAPGYADYADWEAAEAASPAMQAHVDYWLGRFGTGSLPVLELPLDHPRPAVRTFASARLGRNLDSALADAVRRNGAALGTTPYAVLFSGFAALLHRLSGQDDIVIGIAAAGQMAAQMPGLVGHCVNLLPLRVAIDAALPFETLVRQSGGMLLDAFEHQALGYGALLRKLPVVRDPSRMPLVNVLFNVDRDAAPGDGSFPGIEVEQGCIPREAENFELFINVTPSARGLQVDVQYNTDLFDAETIARWLALYECLLRDALAVPARPVGALQWLPEAQAAALAALQPAATPLDGRALMHAAFCAQAATQSARTALRHGDRALSYGELDAQSTRLARALRARGVRRGDRVGLCLPRDADMVVALLAVLKSGAAYVPLDPDFPQARLDHYAADAALALLLTRSDVPSAPRGWRADAATRVLALDSDTAWRNESAQLPHDAALDARAEDAAYVIYTSGSTGVPKGVVVPHGAVANFLQSMRRAPGIAADDVLVAVTTLSFDIAVLELMLPLTVGAQVVIAPREAAMNGHTLAALLARSGATTMQATPGMWRLLLDAGWRHAGHFKALVGGESLPPDLARDLLGAAAEVWNMYGPTETTIWSTLWRVDPALIGERGISIGRPIDNTAVWILDAQRQPLPIGVPGEICIGGAGVAIGYHERPELTDDRFVIAEVDGRQMRLYRTGDRGRWRNDGLLEHMGRFDFQVKVRGYRIELGEVEARCDEAPGVARSVVVTREDRPGDVRLVAYVALTPGATFDRGAIGEHLRTTLPQYMLPQHVVPLDALPLLPNGKIDRKALPAPHADAAPARMAPRTELEHTVRQAMEDVLHLPGLGMTDDFFAMGGHSLLAARLAVQLGAACGVSLSLGTLFEAPTAERLAAAIERAQQADAAAPLTIPRRAERRTAPLSQDQQRMRFAEELHPGLTAFNTPAAHRLTGPMDRSRFEQALRRVVQRQDALRTSVVPAPDGHGWVQRVDDASDFPLPFEDLRGIPAAKRESALAQRLQTLVDEPILAAPAPLFRCALFQTGEREHAFFFMAHHLVWDGYSFDILQREMATAYAAAMDGRDTALPALTVNHGDYAAWHNAWLQGPEADRQRAHWHERLAGVPALAPFPADLVARPGVPGRGRREPVQVPQLLTATLRDLARRHDLTLNMLVMAAYAAALANTVGQPAVAVGMPVRGRVAPALDEVIGLFVGLVPVNLDAQPALGFVAFAASLKQEVIGALAHQDLPFEQLMLQASPAQRRARLYQALFSYQDVRERTGHWGPLQQEAIALSERGLTDDLGLWLLEHDAGLQGDLVYNTHLYTADTVIAFRQRFLDMLAAVATRPDATLAELAAGAAVVAARSASRDDGDDASLLQPEQAQLAQLWASAIGIDVNDIRGSDNFFDLGGDSLLAMRVIQQAEELLGLRTEPRRYVFENLMQLATRAAPAGNAEAAESPPPPAPARGLFGRMKSLWGRRS